MTRKGHKGAYGRFSGRKAYRYKGGWPCYCTRCQRRKTLAKNPVDYLYMWYAMCCGKLLTVDWKRASGVECKENRCDCQGMLYRHRKGSSFCDHGAAAKAGFGLSDRGTDEFQAWLESR